MMAAAKQEKEKRLRVWPGVTSEMILQAVKEYVMLKKVTCINAAFQELLFGFSWVQLCTRNTSKYNYFGDGMDMFWSVLTNLLDLSLFYCLCRHPEF